MGELMVRGKCSDILAALVFALTLIAASQVSADDDKLRFGKSFPGLFQYTPIDVGVAKGFFKAHGIEVEVTTFNGNAKLVQAFAAGALDLGDDGGPGMAFIAKGAPMLAVAEASGPPLATTVSVLASGPIKAVVDLKGKIAGISSVGSQGEWLFKELSRQQGWGSDGIRLVALGDTGAQIAAIRTRSVDMAPLDSMTAYQQNEAGNVRIILKFGDIVKDYVTDVIVASNGFVANHPDEIRRFLAGWFETIAYMKGQRDDTVQIIADNLKKPPSIVGRVYDETVRMLSSDGRFDPKGLAVLQRSFVEMKVLPEAPDMSKLYTEKFLPDAPR